MFTEMFIFSYHRLPVLRCHPYLFSPEKLTTFYAHRYLTFIDFTRVSLPLEGVTRGGPSTPRP